MKKSEHLILVLDSLPLSSISALAIHSGLKIAGRQAVLNFETFYSNTIRSVFSHIVIFYISEQILKTFSILTDD
jgi:hypothetical protein